MVECNYEGVDELRRDLEQGLKTIKQEAEHLVQRRAENEFQRDHEKKIASGEASEALDRAIEIRSEPTAQAQLLTPPVSPIHFTIQILNEQKKIRVFKHLEKIEIYRSEPTSITPIIGDGFMPWTLAPLTTTVIASGSYTIDSGSNHNSCHSLWLLQHRLWLNPKLLL